ncbi:hypothetical protein Tco_1230503 [Tanacetum coccineum]
MIDGQILCSFFISDDNIEFLEQMDLPHQSWLSIFLSEEILYSRMVGIHYALRQNKIRQKLLKGVHYRKTAPIAKSLASHMSSKGKSQSGAIKIRASVNFLLSVLKDSIHSFEKRNGVSF